MAGRYENLVLPAPAEGADALPADEEASDGLLDEEEDQAWQPWHSATAGAQLQRRRRSRLHAP
jgi:hypothetical protein